MRAAKDMRHGYGFKNRYVDVFRGKEYLLNEAADFNPLEVDIDSRLGRKFEIEDDKFDPERYAFDNYDDDQIEEIKEIIKLAPIKKADSELQQQLEGLQITQE